MKIRILPLLFTLAATAGITPLCAQTVDEIVAKNTDAIGGKKVIENVKSMVADAAMSVMGSDAPATFTVLFGKGLKMEADFNGTKIVRVVTDKVGWQINPMAGATTPTPLPDEDYKGSKHLIEVGGTLYNFAAKGTRVELAGQDTADYKLKVTTAEGSVMNYFINKKTWLVDRMIQNVNMQGQDVEFTVTYSDYRKPDNGYLMAYTTEQGTPQFTLTTTFKKIEINKDVDPKIFDMPK